MSWLRRTLLGLHALLGRRDVERQLDEELRDYLENSVERHLAEGMSPSQAARAARAGIGSLEAVKEGVRGVGWESRAESLWQDLRFASRLLLNSPAFASVAILTLALGIGANAAMFTLAYSLLLRPLPYPAAERLVRVYSRLDETRMDDEASTPDYLDWKEGSASFVERMEGFSRVLRALGPAEDGRSFWMLRGSEGLQELLGLVPEMGRLFEDGDVRDGAPRVVILEHDFWRTEFGSDPDIVGTSILLDGLPHTVIGVTAPLEGPLPGPYRAILPWVAEADDNGGAREARDLLILARLRPGVTFREAESAFERIGTDLRPRYPAGTSPVTPVPVSVRDEDVGQARPALLALLGATGLILCLAFANVAYLLLLRGNRRRAELAMRAALGAARGRLVRLLLTESLLLAVIGGIVGVGLASALVRLLISVSPPGIPRIEEVRLDGSVLAVILLLTLVCGILAGLAPVVSLGRSLVVRARPEGGRVLEADRSRVGSALVVGQLVLTLVLLTGAGLMIRSFLALKSVPTGIDFEQIVTFPAGESSFFGAGPRDQWTAELQQSGDVLERVRRIPGVVSAALTSQRPLNAGGWVSYETELMTGSRTGESETLDLMGVTPEFFDLFHSRPVEGRLFEASDTPFADRFLVVDARMASRLWPDQDAVGQRVRFGGVESEVIGVVEPILYGDPAGEARPKVFHLLGRSAGAFGNTALIRYEGDARPIVAAIRALPSPDDGSIAAPQPLREIYDGWFREPRFYLMLLGSLAGLALTVAAVGVYGAVAYSVAQRTPEIGVRFALGAQRFQIAALFLRRTTLLLGAGIAGGLAGAAWLTRYIRSLLFQIEPTDPAAMASMAVLLVFAAVVATLIPLRRALRIDPARTLRSE